jgi:hypothetical protein
MIIILIILIKGEEISLCHPRVDLVLFCDICTGRCLPSGGELLVKGSSVFIQHDAC